MLKPQTSSLSYTRMSLDLSAQTVVQTRISRSDGVAEVLAVCPQVSLISCQPSSGRVNYSGKIIFTLLCSDEEGKLCRMQKGAEFSHFADDENLAPAQTALCSLKCERVTTRRDGSSIILSAVVCAQILVFSPAELNFITSCEGACLKTAETNFLTNVTFSGECEVEDDFEADGVDDILVPTATAMVTSAECGTGEVTLSGEMCLSLLAMRKSVPAGLERVIPFNLSVPCDAAAPNVLPCVFAEVRDLSVNATVDGERGKCRVEFSCTLAASGYFVNTITHTAAVGAFSCTHSLSAARSAESAVAVLGRKLYSERLNCPASADAKLDFSCRFLAVINPSAEYEYVAQNGAVEGSICAILLYEQGDEVKCTKVNMPFSVRVGAGEGGGVRAEVLVCAVSVRQPTEGAIEAEALVKVCAAYPKPLECSWLSGLEEGRPLEGSRPAISVIVAQSGDGLWEAARSLGCPPEQVAAANPDLKYPLSGGERVLIYRKKQ